MNIKQLNILTTLKQITIKFYKSSPQLQKESSKRPPISKIVHVDEFTVGGKEQGKQGRSYDSKKKKAIIAVEVTDNYKVKRVYVKSINDYSCKSLTPIFEEHIKHIC